LQSVAAAAVAGVKMLIKLGLLSVGAATATWLRQPRVVQKDENKD